jgi:hypothetical protein
MFIPNKNDLPIVIHGKEGRGASLFSIKLVAEFVKNGKPLTFWSAYPMAKQEFRKELSNHIPPDVIFIESEDPLKLDKILSDIDAGKTLFVKNFEVIPSETKSKILRRNLLIIAGDLEGILTKEEILKFPTRIFFSPFLGIEIPVLEKYQGYMFSENKKEGIII